MNRPESTRLSDLGDTTLQRSNLKDLAVQKLRAHVISGTIPPGTALVERDVAELLGISRGPVREALLEMEIQGLVENVRGRRKVIQPSSMDIVAMLEVRAPLEVHAATRAACNGDAAHDAAISRHLEAMHVAIRERDRGAFVLADLALHESIWNLSSNPYLVKTLHNLSGPIFLAIVNGSFDAFDWEETYELHRGLVERIQAGDATSAAAMAQQNMSDSIHRNELRLLE
ncbi:GntR family transcriptional regulator [Microbacterium awajiense]|uniref:GntR family transcriptional regulator n=1 Tax=Microbacterium awajiense TaxID=415214 RepID=A0ABP7AS71_9MICO